MKLEDQVCSLELSRRLKEIGVKYHSWFKWISNDNGATWICWPHEVLYSEEFPAFTVAELGEMLPDIFETKNDMTNREYVLYTNIEGIRYPFSDKNEANARGKLLFFLLENGLMELR